MILYFCCGVIITLLILVHYTIHKTIMKWHELERKIQAHDWQLEILNAQIYYFPHEYNSLKKIVESISTRLYKIERVYFPVKPRFPIHRLTNLLRTIALLKEYGHRPLK